MKFSSPPEYRRAHAFRKFTSSVRMLFLLSVWTVVLTATVNAQKSSPPRKLPSAEKIVDNYLKAIGGKNKIAAIKDATYEWSLQLRDQPEGTARTLRKPPSSERWELLFGNGSIVTATSPTS